MTLITAKEVAVEGEINNYSFFKDLCLLDWSKGGAASLKREHVSEQP